MDILVETKLVATTCGLATRYWSWAQWSVRLARSRLIGNGNRFRQAAQRATVTATSAEDSRSSGLTGTDELLVLKPTA